MMTIMMSVTPGIGRGTKDESTMETRKTPKRPRLKKRWSRARECPRCGANASAAAAGVDRTTVIAAGRDLMLDKKRLIGRESREEWRIGIYLVRIEEKEG